MSDVSYEIEFCRLEVKEKVGSGITATVYRGVLDGVTQVAIKEIDWQKMGMDDRQQLAFDREVAIITKVNHPNLVGFFGVSSFEKPIRIITEYCGGGCCFELLHNRDDLVLDWPQQHKMCLDVAQAMDYLHAFSPKIIHRDLKSLNLLLHTQIENSKEMPVIKVSDFGLSRMQDETWGKMTMAAGTCHWMAPEVFAGTNYDEKVDVYSYAMIMFEIICREIPFEEEEAAQVGKLILAGTRPDLEAIPPDCPPAMRSVMCQGWVQDPKLRPNFPLIVSELTPLCSMLWPVHWER